MEDKVSYGVYVVLNNDDVPNAKIVPYSCWFTNYDDARTEAINQRGLEQNKGKLFAIVERNESFTIIEG